MLFSIIIPVYNIEKYISECVESVLNQSSKNYEIILVDDGSMDNSSEICEQYAADHDRIKVIHKENGGLSDARNAGIKKTSGKYIIFLDGDDLWTSTTFLEKAENFIMKNGDQDVILFQGDKYYEVLKKNEEDSRYDTEFINSNTKDEILKHLMDTNSYSMSACTKILLKESLVKYNLYFKKNLLGEDLDWFLKLITSDCSISALDEVNYLYRIREGSITQSISEKNLSDGISTVDAWRVKMKEKNINPAYKKYYMSILNKAHIVNVFNFNKLDRDIKNKYIDKLNDNNRLLKNWTSKKEFLIYFVCSVFGVRITSSLMNFYYNFKKK